MEKKTSDYNTVVKSSQISPPSPPSSLLAFRFFLFLPKKELGHAEGSEPGLLRGKPGQGEVVPEMTVRGVVISQVSGRESTVGQRGLAAFLKAGREPGTLGARKERMCLEQCRKGHGK